MSYPLEWRPIFPWTLAAAVHSPARRHLDTVPQFQSLPVPQAVQAYLSNVAKDTSTKKEWHPKMLQAGVHDV